MSSDSADATKDQANLDKQTENPGFRLSPDHLSMRSASILTIGGYLFLIASALCLFMVVYIVFRSGGTPDIAGSDKQPDAWAVATAYASHLILLFGAMLGAAIGYGLLRSAGAAFKEVIPTKDAPLLYELLRQDKTTGLDNYVKLASLSGPVGMCFKLGITGLPLATIGLTVFFAILGLIPGASSQGFFDLSKLTLGAFIGSFVQRSRLKFGGSDGDARNPDTPGNVA